MESSPKPRPAFISVLNNSNLSHSTNFRNFICGYSCTLLYSLGCHSITSIHLSYVPLCGQVTSFQSLHSLHYNNYPCYIILLFEIFPWIGIFPPHWILFISSSNLYTHSSSIFLNVIKTAFKCTTSYVL